jgi:hypothetical protein
MLNINSSGLVDIFLDRYLTWKDCQRFYQQSSPSVITKDPLGIPVFHYTNIDNINSCNSRIVVIDCLTEGIHCIDIFNQYDPGKHYIIFANGHWNKVQHKEIKISYDLVYSYYFLWDMLDTYCSPARFCFYINKEYSFNYPKPSVFTSTIGNVKPYRTLLVDRLKSLNYDNYILRYSGQDYGIPSNRYDVTSFEFGQFDPYTPLLDEHYHCVSQTIPLELYNQSYFNLVVETDIEYSDSFFPTEKIIKTLFTGMPFVVVGTPHFLQNLKNLGFTTYSRLWNESYDDIENHSDRVDSIVNLCQELANFNWIKYKPELESIKSANRNNFFNLQSVINEEFIRFERIMSRFDT